MADGARLISDFRVMSDQRELFGLVASVSDSVADGEADHGAGARAEWQIIVAANTARRHQGSQNGTSLHQNSQIPDSGDFLPKFLPKKAAQRSREVIYPGHGRKLAWPSRVCYQPSKLVMRVRFPSPALQKVNFIDDFRFAVQLIAI
jgi:hypothetical protein